MELTDQELLDRFPNVPIDADNKDYYAGLLNRQLLIKQCESCGTWVYPPHRPICPKCLTETLVFREVNGRGTVYMFTLLHQGRTIPGVDYSTPHATVAVELEEQEGLRYLGTMIDCPTAEIRIGMPVEVAWVERAGAPSVVFRPATDSEE